MMASKIIYHSTKTAATPTRSARSIRRKAVDGTAVYYCRKISGSWIISHGRGIPTYVVGTDVLAKRWGLSKRRVQQLCRLGYLDAQKVGGVWLVKLR